MKLCEVDIHWALLVGIKLLGTRLRTLLRDAAGHWKWACVCACAHGCVYVRVCLYASVCIGMCMHTHI